jgi:hypothetical protein
MASGRASATVRLLNLRPEVVDQPTEVVAAMSVLDALIQKRGEVRIIRVGTATVVVAGTELKDDEVGGDGPTIVEAIVACAVDMVRFDERAHQRPLHEPEADDDEERTLWNW